MTERQIVLRGITASGRHGASPGERDEPQEFLVDLDVVVDVDADTLDATADYRAIVGAALQAVEQGSVVLLETLTQRVADAVFELEPVLSVRAVVHKPAAADSLGVEDVAAEATAG